MMTTHWGLLSQIFPSVGHGNEVGGAYPYYSSGYAGQSNPNWNANPINNICTTFGDVLQVSANHTYGANNIAIQPGQSWLLLIRVVDTSYTTNLMNSQTPTVENWSAGDGENGNITDLRDKYIDYRGYYCNGSPKIGTSAVMDRSVIWVYRPKQ